MRALCLVLVLGAGCTPRYTQIGPELSSDGLYSYEHEALSAVIADFSIERQDDAGELQRLVDYSALGAARSGLDDYLDMLAGGPDLLPDPDARLAYWLNLYNASVLAAVLDAQAQDSEWSGVSQDGFLFFSEPAVLVGNWSLTLNQIEHGIIRGELDAQFAGEDPEGWHAALWEGEAVDPRIHIGLNCASLGCPNLPPEAFERDTVDASLDALAASFCDSALKGAGPDGVSALFGWYEDDFTQAGESVEGFVEAHRVQGVDGVDFLAELPYDWTLNSTDNG